MLPTNESLLDQIPAPSVIHRRIGKLYRELELRRRLLRLSQAARDERHRERPENQGVSNG